MKKRSSSTRSVLYVILAVLVIVPYLGMIGMKMWYNHKIDKIANARFIVVDKETLSLKLFDYSGNEMNSYGISCGKNPGNKDRIGDLKTPEGIFHITEIEEASTWGHDFKDGKGKIEGAYGPWFLRLEVPGHKGIGIHGTHKPESIGTRDTEGCIRLKNEDIADLKNKVNIGMVVIILPSMNDLAVTRIDSLSKNIYEHNKEK
jgi:lipoprotein-anchoring transpeptidase ErfK/SrfK